MNWKRFVLPATGLAAVIGILILAAQSCQATYYADMVHVGAGQFEMGCDGCQADEAPVHTVRLDGFWMDRYETTFAHYADFLNGRLASGALEVVPIELSDGSIIQWVQVGGITTTCLYPYQGSQLLYADGAFSVRENKQDLPVTVTWFGAQAYCAALKKRLPIEAEWEYAAKGGHLSRFVPGQVDYFRYSGSDDADAVAWHPSNSEFTSHPVGQKLPNELGLFDMSGNVREWVNDWYDPDYYSNTLQVDPQGPARNVFIDCRWPDGSDGGSWGGKVLRGGSFSENLYVCLVDIDLEMEIDPQRVRVTRRSSG